MIYVKVPKLADLLIIPPPKIASVTGFHGRKTCAPKVYSIFCIRVYRALCRSLPQKFKRVGGIAKVRPFWQIFFWGHPFGPKDLAVEDYFPKKK